MRFNNMDLVFMASNRSQCIFSNYRNTIVDLLFLYYIK